MSKRDDDDDMTSPWGAASTKFGAKRKEEKEAAKPAEKKSALTKVSRASAETFADKFGEMIDKKVRAAGGTVTRRTVRNYSPEEAKALLLALKDRYLEAQEPGKFPFKVGDVLTPREESNIRGRGMPHVVLEIKPDADLWNHSKDHSSAKYGVRLNLRVATIMNGTTVCFWNEAHEYEYWNDKIPVVPDNERHSEGAQAFMRWLANKFSEGPNEDEE